MTSPRATSSTAAWLAATGLVASASAIAVGAGDTVAGARGPLPSNCPAGTYLAATRTCELYVASSTTWNVPSAVTSLQILAVGGGGGGGGGTTYAPGGGGGGGAVRVCTTKIVDLRHHLVITVGAGGSAGADGSSHIDDSFYSSEYGDPGGSGAPSSVSASGTLCAADGGQGGEPGYHYLTSDLPDTPLYGGGGNSGAGTSGGSAAGLEVSNSADHCVDSAWEYNLVASGGGGDSQTGGTPQGSVSGIGGDGTRPSTGLFANEFDVFGAGGGGGGGVDCSTVTSPGTGGNEGGGEGGSAGQVVTSAVAGTNGLGDGGGGGAGSFTSADNTDNGVGFPGASGGSGAVIIRFAEPPLSSAAYFATASSSLSSSDASALRSFVTTAIADQMVTVVVNGYTDPRGSVAYNQKLSTARAQAVAAYLRRLFAKKNYAVTITATGKGETHASSNFAKDRVATLSAQGGNFPST